MADKPSYKRRCLRAGSLYSSGCRIAGLALLGLSHHPGVAAVTGSSAGGCCRSSLPSAPCGSRASGSGRGCSCTAGCLKGLWLLGKERGDLVSRAGTYYSEPQNLLGTPLVLVAEQRDLLSRCQGNSAGEDQMCLGGADSSRKH